MREFLKKAIADPVGRGSWSRARRLRPSLPGAFVENLKTDLTEAKAEGRLTVQDLELAADIIVLGIWLRQARVLFNGGPRRT